MYEQAEFGLNAPTKEIPSELELKAREWIKNNPDVMELFFQFAREKLARQQPFGIGALTERVRWECSCSTVGDEYKIPNNHRAYIARKLIEDHPELDPLIVTKKVKSYCAEEK